MQLKGRFVVKSYKNSNILDTGEEFFGFEYRKDGASASAHGKHFLIFYIGTHRGHTI